MAELTIDPTTIRKALDEFVESYKPSDTPTQEVGYVATAGDGIAHVTGLPGCMANELLTFEDGTLGLAFNLDAREIGVVILGDFAGIEEGQEVRRTGEVLSVPVGDGYLGRVVDPLGNPIDGLGEIKTEGRRILEAQAPDVMHRHPVDEPMSTGLKAIDAMTPIGRGQRQLLIGQSGVLTTKYQGSMVHPLRLLLQQRQQLLRRGVIVKTCAAAGGGGDGKINVMQRLGKGGIGGDTIEDVA